MMTQGLVGHVSSVVDLGSTTVDALYRLFARHYDCVDASPFRADLHEKTWVLLLQDVASSNVVGFSTMTLIEACVEGERFKALFSGDTVIDRAYWGSQELVRTWCRFVAQLKRQYPEKLYWFLISKGYRTYLFLPLYFWNFYPRYDRPIPPLEQQLLNLLAATRFPHDFNPMTGIVEFKESHGHLKPEFAAIEPHQLRNPHVKFFLERNPGYVRGHELICLAELSPENMRRLAGQVLKDALGLPRSTVMAQ